MPSRALIQKRQRSRTIQAPEGKLEWNRLMQVVIRRAEQAGDRRLLGLRKALADGKSEQTLRRLGIIHPVDAEREFPVPQNGRM